MRQVARASALVLMLASGALHAGGGHSVTINANVLGNCRFTAPSSSLGFLLDPLASGTLSQTASVQYRCTKGNSASLTLKSVSTNSSAGGNLLRGAEAVPYSIATTLSGGNGNGSLKTLSVTVSISQAGAANVSPGVYTDSIAISLTP